MAAKPIPIQIIPIRHNSHNPDENPVIIRNTGKITRPAKETSHMINQYILERTTSDVMTGFMSLLLC